MEDVACGGNQEAHVSGSRRGLSNCWLELVGAVGVGGELGLDPAVGAGVEHVERKHAAAEDLVVEGADVELGAELASGRGRAARGS